MFHCVTCCVSVAVFLLFHETWRVNQSCGLEILQVELIVVTIKQQLVIVSLAYNFYCRMACSVYYNYGLLVCKYASSFMLKVWQVVLQIAVQFPPLLQTWTSSQVYMKLKSVLHSDLQCNLSLYHCVSEMLDVVRCIISPVHRFYQGAAINVFIIRGAVCVCERERERERERTQ